LKIMAEDFSRLSADVDALVAAIVDVASALRNPAVDKANQDIIDSLANKLEGAMGTLKGAEQPAVPVAVTSDPVADPATGGDAIVEPLPAPSTATAPDNTSDGAAA
jgi:hypothetical protein